MRKLFRQAFNTALRRYTAAGIAFGLLFPIVATIIQVLINTQPVNPNTLLDAQRTNPLLWIIDTAPLFLGGLAFLAGQRQTALQKAYTNLEELDKKLKEQEQAIEKTLELRTSQLYASAVVSRAAASTLDPNQLLREVTNLISERFGFYYAAIFLIDDAGRFAVLKEATGEAGRVLKERNHKLALDSVSMVSAAINTRKPRIALDVGHEPVRFANPLLPDTRSEIALPLIVGDRIFGALDVQSVQEAAFDASNAAVLQAMTDQIALGLNNATSFTDVQLSAQRAKQTAVLLGSTLELTTQTDRESLYENIVKLAMQLVNADGAGLALPISNTELEVKASIEAGPNPRQMLGRRVLTGEGVAGRIFSTKQALRIDDYYSWTGRSPSLTDVPYHAIMGIPLIWQNRVVAVLTITHSQLDRHFTTEDEQSAKLFASQAATSLVNAELRETQDRTMKELDTLNRRLTGEAWSSFTRRLNRTGEDWFGIGDPIEHSDQPEVAEALQHGRVAARSDSNNNLTNVALPIVLRGNPIGVMRLRMPYHNWSSQTAATLESIAGHIAQAIENARLLSATEERFARERVLAEASDKIRRKANVEQILQTAAEELARHLQATRVAVRIEPQTETRSDQA